MVAPVNCPKNIEPYSWVIGLFKVWGIRAKLSAIGILAIVTLLNCRPTVRPARLPTARAEILSDSRLEYDAARLRVDLQIDNPTGAKLDLKAFEYEFYRDEKAKFVGAADLDRVVAAGENARVLLALVIPYTDIKLTLAELFALGSFDYSLMGKVRLSGARAADAIDVAVSKPLSGNLVLPPLPGLELASVRIDDFTLTEISGILALRVTNESQFEFRLSDISFQWLYGNEILAQARAGAGGTLKVGASAEYPVPFRLKPLEMQGGIVNALRGRRMPYRVNANLYIASATGGVKLPLRREGRAELVHKHE